ncbi:hypothetical protein LP415_00590 [Polaromonas sp. P1(28)-8]|nr:hypothetical protein LP415_00590 [Polaromonas sp. P1(28)-8]
MLLKAIDTAVALEAVKPKDLERVVADVEGNVYGGPFAAGFNPICMTFEVTLEEWLLARYAITSDHLFNGASYDV